MTNGRQWVHVLQGGAWILPLFGATGGVLAYMETRSPAIALPIIGLAISLGALALAASKLQRDSADGQSKTYLDAAVTAYGEAEQLVLEEGAGRVEWIGAGRALAYARRFADQIDVSAHKEVLELRRMRARRVLHGALDRPAAFFYGVEPDLPLNEAARQSSATRTVNGRVQIGLLRRSRNRHFTRSGSLLNGQTITRIFCNISLRKSRFAEVSCSFGGWNSTSHIFVNGTRLVVTSTNVTSVAKPTKRLLNDPIAMLRHPCGLLVGLLDVPVLAGAMAFRH